jgi:hypothetical protein
MYAANLWTDQWTRKLVELLFRIRLRAALQACRNLLRTSEREGGARKEPRICTVRQLTAAAGDGPLRSVGSPGQLETSLNSGYLVGPCNSYLEGPTPICFGGCSRMAPGAAYFVVTRRRRTCRLAPPQHGGGAIADAHSRCTVSTEARSRCTVSTDARSSGARLPRLSRGG